MMKNHRGIVRTAFHDHWLALTEASMELRGDREVVLEAMQQSSFAITFASDELLLDKNFAAGVKRMYHILRIYNLSGQQAVVAVSGEDTVDK
eukprot:3479392-Amphidinium_carterae.1